MGVRRRFTQRWNCLCLFLLWCVLGHCSEGRKISGDFQLSGVNTEKTLASFAFSKQARGWVDLSFSTKTLYENEQYLKVHLYVDNDWSKFQKATTCTEKVKYAKKSLQVQFEYNREKDNWNADIGTYVNQEKENRAHYWYVVMTDCSLEYHYRDGKIPKMHFMMSAWNDIGGNQRQDPTNPQSDKLVKLTHLSADDVGMKSLHIVTLTLSMILAMFMGIHIFGLIVYNGSVHAALFLVMSAAFVDGLSSFAELVHLHWYEINGVGWYLFDALSSHWEAMCDSLVSILLLSIASGWTMPSDVVQVSSVGKSWVQSLVHGLRSPAGALNTMNKSGVLAMAIFCFHAILAQWGRTYNEDFDAYHDFEHLPGRILMGFRLVLGLLMIVATVQTKATCPASLQTFYSQFMFVGALWFMLLPLVTWLCGVIVPYYMRHPAVSTYGAISQSLSLVLLSWLVTSHSKNGTSFHKVSRLQQTNKGDLTDNLSSSLNNSSSNNNAPKTWNIGKAKIRLD